MTISRDDDDDSNYLWWWRWKLFMLYCDDDNNYLIIMSDDDENNTYDDGSKNVNGSILIMTIIKVPSDAIVDNWQLLFIASFIWIAPVQQ